MSILAASKRTYQESDFGLSGDSKRCKMEVTPRETDIIFFGHAQLTLEHSGNAAFVDTIKRCLHLYRKSVDKGKIASGIVEGLASHVPPVRFLFRERNSTSWSSLTPSESVAVTSHALLTINNQQLASDERRRKEAMAVSRSSWQPKNFRESNITVAVKSRNARAVEWPDAGTKRAPTLANAAIVEPTRPTRQDAKRSYSDGEEDVNWSPDDLDKVMNVLECQSGDAMLGVASVEERNTQ